MIRTLVIDDDYRVAKVHAASVDRIEHFVSVGQAHSAAEARTLIQSSHRVGSDRGALPGSLPVGFPGPPAAPAVRLSPQRALHVSCQLVSR